MTTLETLPNSQITSSHYIDTGGPAQPQPSPETFHITVLSSENAPQPIIKAVRQTLRDWQDAAYERLAILRRKISELPLTQQPNLQPLLQDDRILIDVAYKELSGMFREHLNSLQTDTERRIFVLTDADQRIQGIFSGIMHRKENHFYGSALLSAPWNISLHSPVPEEHQPLVKKGVGKSLMHAGYRYAQSQKAPTFKLKPLSNSLGFYKYIGMQEDGPNLAMPIAQKIPDSLQTTQISGLEQIV